MRRVDELVPQMKVQIKSRTSVRLKPAETFVEEVLKALQEMVKELGEGMDATQRKTIEEFQQRSPYERVRDAVYVYNMIYSTGDDPRHAELLDLDVLQQEEARVRSLQSKGKPTLTYSLGDVWKR